MARRINITLPEETLALLDGVAKKGGRSRLIDEAVRFYVDHESRGNLRTQLAEGYERRAARDLQLAEEWFAVEEDAWVDGNE